MKIRCKRLRFYPEGIDVTTNKALEFCNQIGIENIINIQEIQEHTTHDRKGTVQSDKGYITIWYKQ